MFNICLSIANISRTGGEERMCVLLANELTRLGHNVIIVSQNHYYWQKPFFKLDSKIKVLSMKRTICDYVICKLFKRVKYDIRKYRRLLIKNSIQLIIDVDTEVSLCSVPASDGLGIKIISWEHFCYQRFSRRAISHSILDCIRNKVDKLVVLTKADYNHFILDANIPKDKVCQIYNPSPIEMSDYIPHNAKRVLAMGRLEYEKGFDLLLQAWAIVEEKNNDWQLEIVGDGSHREYLKNLCNSLNLKSVIFSPFTNTPIDKYKNASVFALSSRHEGLSLALLEAANMSLPIVSFNCPNGPGEIVINGYNGFLIEPDNINAFADAILHLINTSEDRDRFGRNSLDSVSQFKLHQIMEKWVVLIDSLLCNK